MGRGRRVGVLLLFIYSVLVLAGTDQAPRASAETGTKALILETSVSGGATSPEAVEAMNAGFTVTLVDDATWAAMTAAQFADFQLIIVGDPFCGSVPEVVGANKENLADAVMARAGGNTVVGNRIVIGTDPALHIDGGTTGDGGRKVIETGIRFAGAREGATGLYLSTTCDDPDYDGDGEPDAVELLGLLTSATDNWTVNPFPPCGGSASLISNAAQFATLTSAHLQGWSCSVHQTYPTFPTDWSPLALATDTEAKPVCGTDADTGQTACGEAYILIAGSGIVTTAPNLALTPTTATNTVGTTHTVTARVTNTDGTPRAGVLVEFAVTGTHAGATGTCAPVDCRTDANGAVTFTYTGPNAGTDTINAAITVDGSRQTATAEKVWMVSSTTTTSTTSTTSTSTTSTSTTTISSTSSTSTTTTSPTTSSSTSTTFPTTTTIQPDPDPGPDPDPEPTTTVPATTVPATTAPPTTAPPTTVPTTTVPTTTAPPTTTADTAPSPTDPPPTSPPAAPTETTTPPPVPPTTPTGTTIPAGAGDTADEAEPAESAAPTLGTVPPDTSVPETTSTSSPSTSTTGPPGPTTTVPPRPVEPPLQLERPSALPGGEARIRGTGCPPGSDVALRIEGRRVGSARADAGGRFDTDIDLQGFGVGRHSVVSECGGATFETRIDLVVTTSTGATAAAEAATAGAVLCFFVLLAFLLTAGRGGDR